MNTNLLTSYDVGLQFLKLRQELSDSVAVQKNAWLELATLGKDRIAHKLRDQLAAQSGMLRSEFLKVIQFAAAVETLLDSCGTDVLEILFDKEHPQSHISIMRLSRTSDIRQRYRVDGLKAGRFRSVAPQNSDAVFDTVKFNEVPSRLRRACGNLIALRRELKRSLAPAIRKESLRLAELCYRAAIFLQRFLCEHEQSSATIPKHLSKAHVLPALKSREVKGKVAGLGRAAARLTIKNVWDFPEMQCREILPTDAERRETLRELKAIIAAANIILKK